jgi:hypothetical protein
MRVPRFLRHWASMFLVGHTPEVGGFIHDYANGRWKLLHVWNTPEGEDTAMSLIEAMMGGGRDEIYVETIKGGEQMGLFMVLDSEGGTYFRAFWNGIYSPSEAFKDVAVKCREIADKMGYRRPDEPS